MCRWPTLAQRFDLSSSEAAAVAAMVFQPIQRDGEQSVLILVINRSPKHPQRPLDISAHLAGPAAIETAPAAELTV
jgi:hypothetical protein